MEEDADETFPEDPVHLTAILSFLEKKKKKRLIIASFVAKVYFRQRSRAFGYLVLRSKWQ